MKGAELLRALHHVHTTNADSRQPPARRRSYQGLKRSARKCRHTPFTAAGQPSWISPKARTFTVTRVLSATGVNYSKRSASPRFA